MGQLRRVVAAVDDYELAPGDPCRQIRSLIDQRMVLGPDEHCYRPVDLAQPTAK
jgi:hypothetical protein